MMSEDPKAPGKDTRFKKGQSGNPNGRPRKPRQGITPNQLRKDILRVMELPVPVKVGNKEELLTVREATIYSLAKNAIAGKKVAYVKLWVQLQQQVAQENLFVDPELEKNIELFNLLYCEGSDESGIKESLDALVEKSKGKLIVGHRGR
jgi:hypothetical protein